MLNYETIKYFNREQLTATTDRSPRSSS